MNKLLLILTVLLLSMTVISGIACNSNDNTTKVTFSDTNLEAVIREAVEIPQGDIYQTNLAGLTSLSGDKRNIENLTGLEFCTNLTYLDLSDNKISNLSPISSLTSLTDLKLYRNQISNISPLSSLTSLTYLDLWANLIIDIGPLLDNTGLGQGDYIDLSNNPLSDTSINDYIPELVARGVVIEK